MDAFLCPATSAASSIAVDGANVGLGGSLAGHAYVTRRAPRREADVRSPADSGEADGTESGAGGSPGGGMLTLQRLLLAPDPPRGEALPGETHQANGCASGQGDLAHVDLASTSTPGLRLNRSGLEPDPGPDPGPALDLADSDEGLQGLRRFSSRASLQALTQKAMDVLMTSEKRGRDDGNELALAGGAGGGEGERAAEEATGKGSSSKKSRVPTSDIWSVMVNVPGEDKVKCIFCSKTYQKPSGGSTGNLLKHVVKQHAREWENFIANRAIELSQEQQEMVRSLQSVPHLNPQCVRESIVDMVLEGHFPLGLVESSKFKAFCALSNPSLPALIPGREAVRVDVHRRLQGISDEKLREATAAKVGLLPFGMEPRRRGAASKRKGKKYISHIHKAEKKRKQQQQHQQQQQQHQQPQQHPALTLPCPEMVCQPAHKS